MKKKISVLLFVLTMFAVCLPLTGFGRASDKPAASSLPGETAGLQQRRVRVYRQRQNQRARQYRREQRREYRQYRQSQNRRYRARRSRLVRQNYYRNGRRYSRTVRIYF